MAAVGHEYSTAPERVEGTRTWGAQGPAALRWSSPRLGEPRRSGCALSSSVDSGSAGVKPNSPLVSGGNVPGFQISPDSQSVIYRADQITDTVEELWSVSLTAPAAAVKLNGPPTAGGEVAGYFRISPDSAGWSAWLIRRRTMPRILTARRSRDRRRRAVQRPITGPYSDNAGVSGSLVAGGTVQYSGGSRFSQGGSRLLYCADAETLGLIDLFVTDASRPPAAYQVFLPLVCRERRRPSDSDPAVRLSCHAHSDAALTVSSAPWSGIRRRQGTGSRTRLWSGSRPARPRARSGYSRAGRRRPRPWW